MQNFVELTQIKDDPRFGDIVIMFDQSNPQFRVMKKTNKCHSFKEFETNKK